MSTYKTSKKRSTSKSRSRTRSRSPNMYANMPPLELDPYFKYSAEFLKKFHAEKKKKSRSRTRSRSSKRNIKRLVVVKYRSK